MIIAIDATNWIHVLWHALRGKSADVERAFFGRVRLLDDHYPGSTIVCAFDVPCTFRHELFADYKATRKKSDPDLQRTIDRVLAECLTKPVVMIQADGFEADDVLASVARYGREIGHAVVLASPDKDLRQCLVHGCVTIMRQWKTHHGTLYPTWLTAAMLQQQTGLAPQQWIDYQTLIGDAGDNVPGCPGIGEVTAKRLLQDHGTLDEVLRDPWRCKVTARQREHLFAFRGERRDLIRRLVTLETMVPWIPEALNLEPAARSGDRPQRKGEDRPQQADRPAASAVPLTGVPVTGVR